MGKKFGSTGMELDPLATIDVLEDRIPVLDASDTTDDPDGTVKFAPAYVAAYKQVVTEAEAADTYTVDMRYPVYDVTMDDDTEFSFSQLPPAGYAAEVILIVRGAHSPTFAANVDPGSTTITYEADTIYRCLCPDGVTVHIAEFGGGGYTAYVEA